MSQDYVDDLYEQNIVSDTTLQNMEKNFAALKSSFFGATTPSNTVAGMWWFDTTADILKLRNEANNAWQSIWDFANNKPVVTNNVSGDFGAALRDPAADTAGLRTLGTEALKACAGNDSRLSDDRTSPDASVSQSKLKTSLQTTDLGGTPSSGHVDFTSAGTYGFYPQIQGGYSSGRQMTVTAKISFEYGTDPNTYGTLLYYTLQGDYHGSGSANICRARMRYISASGEIHWLFIMRLLEDVVTPLKDVDTGKTLIYKKGLVMRRWQSPDHPCFGTGSINIPHPFHPDVRYIDGKPVLPIIIEGQLIATPKVEIIVINPTLKEIEQMELETVVEDETKSDKDLLEVITENYEIDENSNPAWPSVPVTVGLPKHIKDKKGKKVLADYRFMNPDTIIEPIKKVIPKPSYIKVKRLKRINHA